MLSCTIRRLPLKLEQFKDMVALLQETFKVSSKAGKYIKSSVFSPFDKLIMMLLGNIYEQEAIQFILFEWLNGNKSPLTVPIDEQTTVVYPLNTVEDLYKAMEIYKLK